MEDASQGGSEQMALLSVESRVHIHIGVQVSSEDMLDQAGLSNVLRAAIGELNPVTEQVWSNPENNLIDALAAWLSLWIARIFLRASQATNSNPVVLLASEDFTSESEGLSSRHDSQTLKNSTSKFKQSIS